MAENSEQLTEGNRESHADESSALPTGLFVDLWSVSIAFALVVGCGLAPALRGAAIGLDTWIERIDDVAGVASQFAALVTFFLLVHYGVMCLRFARPVWQSLAISLGAAMVSMLLVSAQQITLGRETAVVGTFAALLVVGVAATKLLARSEPTGPVVSAIGLFLAVELLGTFSLPSALGAAIAPARWVASVFGLVAAVRLLTRTSPRPLWLLATLFGSGAFSALLVRAAASGDAPAGAMVAGRALRRLATDPSALVAPAVQAGLVGIGLAAVLVTVWFRLIGSRRGLAETLLGVVGALLLSIQPSPLTLGALSLVGLALVASASAPRLGAP